MGFLDTLRVKLDLSPESFSNKLKTAHRQLTNFSKSIVDGYSDANAELKRHTLGLKDTARIVQGIVISQAFYGATRAISSATSALMEFNEQMDYAQVTYTALFGSSELASGFVKALQEKSVDTIFEYQDLADASKKLLSYGIEYKNLMYVMDGLTNLGAMSGDKDALTRVARAMGQIYTKGYIKAEEMKQLADAYVPIYDIIQQSFGLTSEQMGKVGDLKIPAYQVLNAIVDYANAKFGSVGEAAMYTITGLKNRVVDTMKVMGSEMMMPLTRAWKSFLAYVADGLQTVRDLYTEGGWGAIFEALVPDSAAQETIRTFLANIINFGKSIISIFAGIAPLIGQLGQAFMVAFNIVGPVISGVINIFAALLRSISQNTQAMAVLRVAAIVAAGAFVVLKVHALGALVITAVTKAVMGLGKALLILSSLVTRHPILMLLAGLTVALVGVSAASNNAGKSLSGLFSTMNKLGGGTSQDGILQNIVGDTDDLKDASEQFNDPFGPATESAEEFEDAINGAGKAAKKNKSLLSFDEVFKLNDPSDGAAGAFTPYDAGTIEDLISGLGALGDALIPEIPDFTEFIDGFVGDLFGGIFEKIKAIASAGVTGALIGGLAGFAIGALVTKTMSGALAGAKLGAKIGTAAGAGFAAFWADTYAQIESSLHDVVKGGATGLLAGALAGFIIGAFATRSIKGALEGARLGAAIGTLAGGTVAALFSDWKVLLETEIGKIAAGGAEGALVGALAGLVIGAFATRTLSGALTGAKWGSAIGSAIGTVVGAIFGDAETTISDAISSMFANIEAMSIGSFAGALAGTLIGAAVGAFAGGPAGALAGAKLGATVGMALGSLVGLLTSYLETSGIKEGLNRWFSEMGTFTVQGFFEGIGAFFVNVGTWLKENLVDPFVNGFKELFGIHSPSTVMRELGEYVIAGFLDGLLISWDDVVLWLSDALDGFTQWVSDIGDELSLWWDETKQGFQDWKDETSEKLSLWWAETKQGFSEWYTNTKQKVSTWWNETKAGFSEWYTNTKQKLSTWWAETKTGFNEWYTNTKQKLSTWWNETKTGFSEWYTNTKQKLSTWWTETKHGFSEWYTNTKQKISTWWAETKTGFNEWYTNTKQKLSTWWTETKTGFNEWKTNTGEKIRLWASDAATNIRTKFDEAIRKIKEFFGLEFNFSSFITNTGNKIREWAAGIWNNVRDFFGKAIDKIKEFFRVQSSGSSGVSYTASYGTSYGHATGGVFNREHIARFAEGNKAEAIIPLENKNAMQPFVDAVAQGLLGTLGPIVAQGGGNNGGQANQLPPLYVGTLVADERGLKELYKKFEIIQIQEQARTGRA